MNKRFFSKLSLTVAVIGAVGALSPSQVNASNCYKYTTKETCDPQHCDWMQAVAQCLGEPKACWSDHARNNEEVCNNIHGCHWFDPGNVGFCTPK